MFTKRRFISYFDKKIYLRLNYNIKYLDYNRMGKAITPNSIHCVDFSILFLTISKCRKLGIPISIIHDSIGSPIEYAFIIKILYKISTIEIIEKSRTNDIFPLYENLNQNIDFEDLYKKILKSKKYFN